MGYISYQVYKTHKVLNRLLDTYVVDVLEPPIQEYHDANKEFDLNWLDTKEPSILSFRWIWNHIMFAYARRLLHMANNDEKQARLRTVQQLGSLKGLSTWNYYTLSKMCDARTAVGLARVDGVDLRFFAEPPLTYFSYNREKLLNTMKDFLVALHAKSKHVCLEYFINEAFEDAHVSWLS